MRTWSGQPIRDKHNHVAGMADMTGYDVENLFRWAAVPREFLHFERRVLRFGVHFGNDLRQQLLKVLSDLVISDRDQ
ncbi:MAG: hypothetical protein L0Z50_10065 [Verrucomicrobiales bacterium]|nr:hypothetical protein [Verrucomicrobiales bacterium]